MPASRKAITMDHPVVIAFLIFAVIGFMRLAAEVLKPLALAVLLSFALVPLARFLERRGLPRVAAEALGRHPDPANLRPLLDLGQAAPSDDTHLIHVVRMALRDQILVPTLSRAERDRAREELDDSDLAFIWRVIADMVDDLEQTPVLDLKSLAAASEDATTSGEGLAPLPSSIPALRVMGVPANDRADELVLRMLAQLLAGSGCELSIVAVPESPLVLADLVAESHPDLVVLSHLPPAGFTNARYLVRRLRARFADLPVLVGRWCEIGDKAETIDRLTSVGASRVVFRLAEARDVILNEYLPKSRTETEPEDATPLAPVAS